MARSSYAIGGSRLAHPVVVRSGLLGVARVLAAGPAAYEALR
jgi:hypothetical protein